jgi:predicted nucleic acid-binding protein
VVVRGQTICFLDGLRANRALRIIVAGPELLEAGWNLFCQRPDKDWGLTDCTSFAVMQRERLGVALTADQHFVQAGFRALMLEE